MLHAHLVLSSMRLSQNIYSQPCGVCLLNLSAHQSKRVSRSQNSEPNGYITLLATCQGKRLLRLWFLRPLVDMTALNERHDAIEKLKQVGKSIEVDPAGASICRSAARRNAPVAKEVTLALHCAAITHTIFVRWLVALQTAANEWMLHAWTDVKAGVGRAVILLRLCASSASSCGKRVWPYHLIFQFACSFKACQQG